MRIAILRGTSAGMILHLATGFVLWPLLGMFQTMMSASLIGMYGGMLSEIAGYSVHV